VIVALGTPNQGHINFRDSKLTRILQPSLSGNARMAVVCCATPSELYLEETRSTLLFASRAKLVKTNAQVNEVLDDRSIIRRLQRELAEARRHGGGAAAKEHVRSLEHKAEQWGTAAREAEEKLKRLYASILNNDGPLFGESTSTAVAQPKKRQRRLSDGNLTLGRATPIRSSVAASLLPQTVPRPLQPSTSPIAKWLSPNAELSMLRQALAAKSENIASISKDLDESSKLLQEKELELLASNCSNELLKSDRDSAVEQSSALSLEIAELKSQMEALSQSHEQLVKEKDVVIAGKIAQLEQEHGDRQVLEETVDSLQEAKGSLEQDLVSLRESTTTHITELEEQVKQQSLELDNKSASNDDLVTTNATHESRIAELEKELAAMQEEATVVAERHEEEKTNLRKERDSKSDQIQQLTSNLDGANRELSEVRISKESALEQIKSLGDELSGATLEVQTLQQANTGLENKVAAAKAENEELTTTLGQTSSELAKSMGQVEELQGELALVREELVRAIDKSNSDKTILQQSIDSKSDELQALTGQLEETVLQLSETRSAKDKADEQVHALNDEV